MYPAPEALLSAVAGQGASASFRQFAIVSLPSEVTNLQRKRIITGTFYLLLLFLLCSFIAEQISERSGQSNLIVLS